MSKHTLPEGTNRASRRARDAMKRRGETLWSMPLPINVVERERTLNRRGRSPTVTSASPYTVVPPAPHSD